ncbi:type II secretion system protein [Clostridium disporicum]|uniref:Pilin n=1 Tax=Clostridium disporicum TaxID=84024 RepID=A0A174HRH6_9CLOT|nr:type II secretion system protein [Clostridium disporicum]CUO75718.1 Pilin [Clostridium disporicum]
MKLNKKKKGFTLIELMAVIAIVAILAAVLVPTVSGYINRSKKSAIVTQARTVVNAVESYNATSENPLIETLTDSGELPISTTLVSALPSIVGTDILDLNAISKLGNMTLAEAKAINFDSDAIKNLKIYPDGVFARYKELRVAAHTELVGEEGSEQAKYPVTNIK